MNPFVRAKRGKGRQVIYYRADGSSVTFIGGDRPWRNQNPGNITARGDFATKHGSIGSEGGFAIFPSYEVGRAAIFSLLETQKYQERTIDQAVTSWAPKKDKNNPKVYKNRVRKWTGLDLNRKVKDLTKEELEKLVSAIERMEGGRLGHMVEERGFMSKKTLKDEPIGELHQITDFLPSPEVLFPRDEMKKITLDVDSKTVDFFKAKAKKMGTKYQKMMREVLKVYAKRYN